MPACALAALAALCASTAARVEAQECRAASVKPHSSEPAEITVEARVYAKHGHYEQARAMYLAILKEFPLDDDAHVALARVDAWEGCYDRAETRLRAVLGRNPRNHEARGALADVLLWQRRHDEVRELLDAGLALDPDAGEVWLKRAKLMLAEGDATRAREAADRAYELMPDDEGARDLHEHIFLYQLRGFVRSDFYPAGYPNVYTEGLQFLRRYHKLELTLDAVWVGRIGGDPHLSIVDGIYGFGLAYRVERFTVGLGLGFGIPARAVPAFQGKLSLAFPIITRWSGLLGYSFWEYQNGKRIHIYNLGLSYELADSIRLDALWWTSLVLAPRLASFYPQVSDTVHVASLRATYIHSQHLSFGVSYTYGPQLDQTEDPERLLGLKSQIFGAFGDWLITHHVGLQPAIDLEQRRPSDNVAMYIVSAQLAAYLRW